jgi:hypothetical protein
MFDTTRFTLTSALATAGTVTVGYPAGRGRGDYQLGFAHRMTGDNGANYVAPRDFELTLNAANITLTWRAAGTVPNGTNLVLDLDRAGLGPTPQKAEQRLASLGLVSGAFSPLAAPAAAPNAPWAVEATLALVNLGSPIAAAANGIALSQSVAIAPALTILNGARVFGGVGVLDLPRNVVAAWTNTAVCTVTGFDVYGRPMTESSASGTSMTGLKAFKRITSVTFSAAVTGATVGFGNVLGLPFIVPSVSLVLREIANLATPTAGTFVAAALGRPSATTGDVRGTWTPNTAPDGSVGYQLLIASLNPEWDFVQA